MATPFYRALADPLGPPPPALVFNGCRLADVFEEDFDDPDSLAGSGGVPDPLLARAGPGAHQPDAQTLRDDPGEQDTIITAAGDVPGRAGRPGHRKTAVGLHRAAFLLYHEHRGATRGGVLVVGPNPVFLRYISQVLRRWSETSATQTTVDGLLGLRFASSPTTAKRRR